MSRTKKEKCPICGKAKKFTREHYRINHPESPWPGDVLAEAPAPVPEPTPAPAIAPAPPPAQEVKPTPELQAKRLPFIKKWKMIPGVILGVAGAIFTVLYTQSLNYGMGIVAVVCLAPALYLVYSAFDFKRRGYVFTGEDVYTGKENAIVIYARKGLSGMDIPYRIAFKYIKDQLEGARPHLLRNTGKHYYEYINDTSAQGEVLKNVEIADENYLPPEDAKVPACMQPVKEYLEYNPPTAIQKISASVMVIAMFVVGILMALTQGQPAPGA
jgi:hypothetical protein